MRIIEQKLNEHIITQKLKQGGQKRVLKATNSEGQDLALKIGTFSSISSFERIKREIDILSSINSKYYPQIKDFIVDYENKEFLIIEEFINSLSFNEVSNSIQTESDIIDCFREILMGLQIIWDQKIYHRDIKPDNILFKSKKEIVIIDLGIARVVNLESLTNTMALRGPCTPIFASPEQLTNKKNLIDQRTDFFSLGILLTLLLYGVHPFDPKLVNPQKNIIENIISEPNIDLRESYSASVAFSSLINKLLEKQQYNRFRNCNQIYQYLDENWS